MQTLPAIVASWILVAFITVLAVVILYKVWRGHIDFSGLLSEPLNPGAAAGSSGKASLSRLQFLLFTFVISGLYLALSLEAGKFVDFPSQVLGLLGISGGSYVVSKGMGKPGGGAPPPDGS